MLLRGALSSSTGAAATPELCAGGGVAERRRKKWESRPCRTDTCFRRRPADQTTSIARLSATATLSTKNQLVPVRSQPPGLLGVRGGATVFEPVSTITALGAGVTQTLAVTVQTFDGVIGMITRRTSSDDMGGPLRIAQMSGQVASLGLASLVSFIAILSVNLGLLNLFPIPVLDGGHLVFYAFEALRGRPLPARAQEYGYRAGFAVLIGLFVFATWNDLGHLGLFRWVAGLIG